MNKELENQEYEECENWKRRGDEFYDQLCNSQNEENTNEDELNRLKIVHDDKLDEYKELIILNARLRVLLADNGIDHDY